MADSGDREREELTALVATAMKKAREYDVKVAKRKQSFQLFFLALVVALVVFFSFLLSVPEYNWVLTHYRGNRIHYDDEEE